MITVGEDLPQPVLLEDAVVYALVVLPAAMLTGSPAVVALTTVIALGVLIRSLNRQID